MIRLIFLILFFSHILSQSLTKLNTAILLDGFLNDSVWQTASSLNEFYQIKPNLGEAATEQNSVKINYDDEFLYIGAEMNYSDITELYVQTKERDRTLSREDYIEIHIDANNDRSSTRIFRTNFFAAREDYESSLNGEELNYSWNAFWDVKTAKNKTGWTAEFKIPFSSLQFEEEAKIVMRIKAVFNYKIKNEQSISDLANTERTPLIYLFSNSREFAFSGIKAAKPIFITPYIKADVKSQSLLNSLGSAYSTETELLQRKHYLKSSVADKTLSNFGFDFRFKPSSNKSINITVNTDFAQVEADDQIINVSRFPISLSEKREFFLENADLFNSNQFDHRLFHSRRIGIHNGKEVPIIAGFRFVSKTDKWQSGFLSMQSHELMSENLSAYNSSVARLKRQIDKKGSYIGFLGTAKVSSSDYNYLAALDANLRFGNGNQSRFTLASTFDKEKGNWRPMYGASVTTFKSNGFGLQYRYREYTEDFNPELAFLFRPNTKRLTLNHGWRQNFVNSRYIDIISVGNYITQSWLSSSSEKELFQTNFYTTVIFTNGMRVGVIGPVFQKDQIASPWQARENVLIPAGEYEMWKFEPSFSTGNAFSYNFDLDLEFGDYYGGKQFSYTAKASNDFTESFFAEIGINQNKLNYAKEFVHGGSSSITLSRYFAKLRYAFSTSFFLNSYIQYDSQSKQIAWNLRLRFTEEEASNFYLVYNQNVNLELDANPRLERIANQSIILKFSKTLSY